MKPLTNSRKKTRAAFTLIEMIGVLAVIAILAAVLIPKVFEAINNARVNNAAMSCQTVKTALSDHYAKYGSIPYDGNTTNVLVATADGAKEFDDVLLKEGFLDKPFEAKIGSANLGDGTGTRVQLLFVTGGTASTTVDATAGNFDLDGDAKNDILGDATVAVAIIKGVTAADAYDLSKRIDGDQLSQSDLTAGDAAGRVEYAAASSGGTTDVYVYLTHR